MSIGKGAKIGGRITIWMDRFFKRTKKQGNERYQFAD